MQLPESIDKLAPGIYADVPEYERVFINPLEIANDQDLPTDPTSLFNIYAAVSKEYADAGYEPVLVDEQEQST